MNGGMGGGLDREKLGWNGVVLDWVVDCGIG